MKHLVNLVFFMTLAVSSKGQTPLELQEIHFVIIETNITEVNKLQEALGTFRPVSVELPIAENMEIAKGYPTKPGFWYKTGEDQPSRYNHYNSPEDTLGKDVSFIPSRDFKLPKSGLSALVNGFDKHYCIVVRQFINQNEASQYIKQLISEKIIPSEANAFPIPIGEYDHDNLRFNFDTYLPSKPAIQWNKFKCSECKESHDLVFKIIAETSESLVKVLDEDPQRVFRSTKDQYRVDTFLVFPGSITIETEYESDFIYETWISCEFDEIQKAQDNMTEEHEVEMRVQLYDNLLPYYKNTKGLNCIASINLEGHKTKIAQLRILDESELKQHQDNGLTKSQFENLIERKHHTK